MSNSIKVFEFSVIIESKGNAEYLEEAINSLLNQTLGFAEQIQLIVTCRESYIECKKVVEDLFNKYSDNIILLTVPDLTTPGKAINMALKKACGKYVNIMYEKDRWSMSAFKKCAYYFEHRGKKVNYVLCRLKHFGADNKFSKGDFVYEKTDFVKLETDKKKDYSHFGIGNIFFKKSFLSELSFDQELQYGEDVLFVNTLILKDSGFNVIDKIIYYQRIPKINKSVKKHELKEKSYYLDVPSRVYGALLDMCKTIEIVNEQETVKIDETKKLYVQKLVLHEIAVRAWDNTVDEVLDDQEKKQYFENLKKVVQQIDDYLIYDSIDIQAKEKLYLLHIKNDNFFDIEETTGSSINVFKFSVIIESKGNAEYLEEAINSLLNQTLGFGENIQLIVMCRESYAECQKVVGDFFSRYPNNIILMTIPDSTAPGKGINMALEKACAKYVNIMYEKDRWSISAFKKCAYYFEHKGKKVNYVLCRLKHFGADKDYSNSDFVYKKTDFVKLGTNKKKDYSHFGIGNIIFKKSFLSKLSFDQELQYGEDLLFVNTLILKDSGLNVIDKIIYNQRIPKINKFATKHELKEKSFYLDMPSRVYGALFDMCKTVTREDEEETFIIDKTKNLYVQKLVMHEIADRAWDNTVDEVLDAKEKRQYFENIKGVLQQIDNRIIYASDDIHVEQKLFLLGIKYDGIYNKISYLGHGKICFKDFCVYDLNKPDIVRVEMIDIEKNVLKIDGRWGIPFPKDACKLYFEDQDGKRYQDFDDRYDENIYAFGELCFHRSSFHLRIPIERDMEITPYIHYYYGGIRFSLKLAMRKWSKIEGLFENSYYMKNGIVLTRGVKSFKVTVTDDRSKFEEAFQQEIIGKGAVRQARFRKKVLFLRKKYKKRIWLIADNLEDGNDNAETLARWICKNGSKDIKVVFLLNKTSKAKRRIRKFCTVVYFGSILHKLAFLSCEYFICSRTDPFIYTFLESDSKYFKDLYPQFIYLQHGVLEKDFTKAVNKFANNFRMFMTSAIPEYNNMIRLPYGWDETEIRLNGLARHDDIYQMVENVEKSSNPVKEVIIAPTWRKNLAKRDGKVWGYFPNFKESDFFKFYNALMNDERLLNVMRGKGYNGKLRLHTVIKANAIDFQLNDCFALDDRNLLFKEQFHPGNKVLITDYSSIASDYAYGKIPVIYAQFDREEFYNIQSYDKGDFDYEKNGFGPVCYDYESTVNAIIDAINNDCIMTEEILNRRNNFFKYYDNCNSERIYNDILNIESKE